MNSRLQDIQRTVYRGKRYNCHSDSCKQRKMKKYKGEEGMYELSFFFFSFEKIWRQTICREEILLLPWIKERRQASMS